MMMKVERGNAAHPVNAILNYVYAALESQIRIKPTSCITFYVVHHAPTTVSLGWSGTTKIAHPVLDFVKRFRPRQLCHSHRRCVPAQAGHGETFQLHIFVKLTGDVADRFNRLIRLSAAFSAR
jgi:hypothetical protein